jgi:hypothetical protein
MKTALIALATSLSLISLGGGIYEFVVVDPAWPRRPDIIQPALGGVSRRRFWIPAHICFELLLLVSLFVAWSDPNIRYWLLLALASHVIMRVWSAFYFIPRALRFERMPAADITESIARSWTRLSLLRMPLDLITCAAMLAAVTVVAQ